MLIPVLEILLVLAAFVAYPLYSWRTFPAEKAAVAEGRKSRMSLYRETMLFEWVATAMAVLLWMWAGRTLPHLGLGPETGLGGDGLGWTALGVLSTILAFLVIQTAVAFWSADARRQLLGQARELIALLPHTRSELAGFAALSVTAGVCEEILFRGYLTQWLSLHGLGLGGAAVLSTFAFGLAHAYQGWAGALKAGITGAVLMALALLTGSLWASILLHTVLDLSAGLMAYVAVSRGESDGEGERSGATFETTEA